MGCYTSSTENEIFEESCTSTPYSHNQLIVLEKAGDIFHRESDIVNATYTNPVVESMFSGVIENPRDSELAKATYKVHSLSSAGLTESTDLENATFTNSVYKEEVEKELKRKLTSTNSFSGLTESTDLEKATFTNKAYQEEMQKCDQKVKMTSPDFVYSKPNKSRNTTKTVHKRKLSYQYDKTSGNSDFVDQHKSSKTQNVHEYDEIGEIQKPGKTRHAENRLYMSLSDDCIFSVPNYFKTNNSFSMKQPVSASTGVYESIAVLNVTPRSTSE